MLKLAAALCLSILTSVVAASGDHQVAVYWGQNSNRNQGTLASYCETDDIDIILLSFLTDFPDPLQLNFANMCGDTFPGGLLHCSQIGKDIKTCQAKGKKILLSMGGAISNYKFTSEEQARNSATTLWNKFGEGMDTQRPFDDAVVDGFDFDLEGQNIAFTEVFAQSLKDLTKTGSKKFYMSSAPQCFLPDYANGNILQNVELDFIFIQFYNNWCNLGPHFNFAEWQDFISSRPVKNSKLFVTLPGNAGSAGSGYVDAATVKRYVDEKLMSSSEFGGFGFWDASSACSNTNSDGVSYLKELRNYLDGK